MTTNTRSRIRFGGGTVLGFTSGELSAEVTQVENQPEMYRAHNRLHYAHPLNYASGGRGGGI